MTHRIRRAVFVLECPDQGAALRTRNRLEVELESSIVPALDRLFDELSPGGDELRFDRLEVDLGTVDPEKIAAAAVVDAVRKAVRASATPGAAVRRSLRQAITDAWGGFLRTGRLDWDAPADTVAGLERLILELPATERERVILDMKGPLSAPSGCLRLAHQFGRDLFRTVVRSFAAATREAPPERRAPLIVDEEDPRVRAEALHAAVISGSLPSGPAPAGDRSGLRAPPSNGGDGGGNDPGTQAPPPRATPPRRRERGSASAPSGESPGFPIPHAGLVLLHPYLPRFFVACGFLDETRRFRSVQARHDAVWALHHAAAGHTNADEHALAVPRVLCGCPDDEPSERRPPPSPAVVEETERLLRTVIAQWSSLGSTSIDGLREGFLTRPGVLVPGDSGWRIRVEHRGIDVLLGTLPWGLSIIRLPWLARPIHVDWA